MLTLAACAGCPRLTPGAAAGAAEAAVYAVLLDSVVRYPRDTVVVLDARRCWQRELFSPG